MKPIKTYLKLTSIEWVFNYVFSSVILLGMMVLVVCDVAGRYLFKSPVHGTLEITEFLMVAIVYFTFSHTQAEKAHIKVELLQERMPEKIKQIFELIAYILALSVFVLIIWQGWLSAMEAYEYGEETDGYINLPLYPAKFAIPLGSFILCMRLLTDIFNTFNRLKKPDEKEKA